jgi:F-box domain
VIQRGNEGSVDAHEPDQKRARVRERLEQPLEKDEVLDEIFSFVGRKEWLYAGCVCRRWRDRYLSMCYKARAGNDEHAFQTSHKSSFVTAARFSLALDNGLQMPDERDASKLFNGLPVLSQQPIQVLTLARVHGAAWHERLSLDAAYYGNVELLKWLHASGCPWNFVHVAMGAIACGRSDSADMLRWLLQTGMQLNQHDKNKLLFVAGVRGCVDSAEMLLQQGAEWPQSFVGQLEECITSPDKLLTCWHYRAVAWARSKSKI